MNFISTNRQRQGVFFLFISLLVVTGQLFAQETNETECPYFNITSTDSTGVLFSLVSTSIDATISGVIANVEVEQLYVNSGDSTVNSTYVFPMSTNAAIYGMEMDVNDKTIVAEIRRRAEAEEIFENADSLGWTASLLEQERPNVFIMSLANVNPGDSIRVRMVYTELLVPENGEYQFIFPNVVGPRFTTNGEPWVNQAAIDYIPLSETELIFNLQINAGMDVVADCISHTAVFENDGTTTKTNLITNPGSDFIVNYSLDGNQIQTGLLLFQDSTENFFLSMIQPAKPDVAFESPQREYIFILDVSGSMNGEPLEIAKELLINLLTDLNNDDKFNILFFAGGSQVLSTNSLDVTIENIDLAIEMIEGFDGGGSTQLLPAMDLALSMVGTEGFSRTFVIFTDGFVTVEKEAFELIRENLNEANFFSFGIGNNINHFIIEGIAYVGEGESFVVTENNNPTEVASAFKEYIERPVLTNIEILFDGIDVYEVEPFTVPDVFAERPIIVYGKYSGPPDGTITLEGDYADGVVTHTLNFADYQENMDENIALKYLWARKRIRLMSDYGIASNENDTISIEEEITLLGLKYSLVTEFTSFVAVDSNAVSTPTGNENGNGGGTTVDINEFQELEEDKLNYLDVFGTVVSSEGTLRIFVENLPELANHAYSFEVRDVQGVLISRLKVDALLNEQIIELQVGILPKGAYFISLVSNNVILDTEKFIVGH